MARMTDRLPPVEERRRRHYVRRAARERRGGKRHVVPHGDDARGIELRPHQ